MVDITLTYRAEYYDSEEERQEGLMKRRKLE